MASRATEADNRIRATSMVGTTQKHAQRSEISTERSHTTQTGREQAATLQGRSKDSTGADGEVAAAVGGEVHHLHLHNSRNPAGPVTRIVSSTEETDATEVPATIDCVSTAETDATAKETSQQPTRRHGQFEHVARAKKQTTDSNEGDTRCSSCSCDDTTASTCATFMRNRTR